MTQLLEAREWIKGFYAKYEQYLVPATKFIFGLIIFSVINITMGYMSSVSKFPIALILALMCSFLPFNIMVILAGLFTLLQVYAVGIESMAIVGIVYLIIFLLYFRFTPKDAVVVLLTPLMFVLKIPYAVPLCLGFVGNPLSVVSVSCGVVVYYVLKLINATASAAGAGFDIANATGNIKSLVEGIVNNKEMLVTIVAFSATVLVVYLVRRMNIDFAWTIALVVGALTDVLILLVGDLIFTTNISIVFTLVGTAVGAIVAKIIQFFVFNLDYTRTEKVQFEDDEYYYFVKAVPKVAMAKANRTHKMVSNGDTIDGPASDRAIRQVREATGRSTEMPERPATRTTGRPATSVTGRPVRREAKTSERTVNREAGRKRQ